MVPSPIEGGRPARGEPRAGNGIVPVVEPQPNGGGVTRVTTIPDASVGTHSRGGALSPVAGAGAADSDFGLRWGRTRHEVEKSTTGSYVVIMAADPLWRTYDRHDLNSARARADRARIRESHRQVMRDAGVAETDKGLRLHQRPQRLLRRHLPRGGGGPRRPARCGPGHARRDAPTDHRLQPRLPRAHRAKRGVRPRASTVSGVVVGVIDTGIWPEHPSFADDGIATPTPTSHPATPVRVRQHRPQPGRRAVHVQQQAARRPPDAGDLPRRRSGPRPDEFDSARDDDGHGSHTASTAAGNGGVEADDLRPSTSARSPASPPGRTSSPTRASATRAASRPTWRWRSTRPSPTASTSSTTRSAAAPSLTRRRRHRLPVRRRRRRVRRDFGRATAGRAPAPSADPPTCRGSPRSAASTQSRFFQGTVELGNVARRSLGASHHPAGVGSRRRSSTRRRRRRPVPARARSTPPWSTGKIVLCRRGVNARVDKSLAVLQAGGVGMILYDNDRRRQPVHRQPLGADGPRRQHAGPDGQGLHRRHGQPDGAARAPRERRPRRSRPRR